MTGNFKYSLKEATHYLSQNKIMIGWNILIITISIFLLNIFILSNTLMNNMLGSIEDQLTIRAYIDDSTTTETTDKLINELKTWDNIKNVELITKEQAWEEYTDTIGQETGTKAQQTLNGVNPLPASIIITVNNPNQIEQTAQELQDNPTYKAIADLGDTKNSIDYGKEATGTVLSLTNTVKTIIFILTIILLIISTLLTTNTTKNTIYNQKEEIATMRLIGANNKFIKQPYILQTLIQALIATITGNLLTLIIISITLPNIKTALPFLNTTIPTNTILTTILTTTIIIILVMITSTTLTMKKHLKQ